MNNVLDTLTGRAPAALLAASAGLLATVFAMQYWGGLAPCRLCIAQRWPHGAVIVLAGLAMLPVADGVRRTLLGLAALALITGSAIAVYHTGIELHWFPGLGTCSGVAIRADTLDELRRQLMAAPVVRCDEVPWSLFGISLAGYNVLASAALAALAVAAALRRKAGIT